MSELRLTYAGTFQALQRTIKGGESSIAMLSVLGCLGLVVVLSLLDPVLWIMVALSSAERQDRKDGDLHIWQRSEL